MASAGHTAKRPQNRLMGPPMHGGRKRPMSQRSHALCRSPCDAEILSGFLQTAIQCPEAGACHERGREKADVYPPEPAPPEAAILDERHRLAMRDRSETPPRAHYGEYLASTWQRAARQVSDDER